MLGAVASGDVADLVTAMASMNEAERTISPADGAVAAYHEQKHRLYHRMYDDQMAYRAVMRA